MEARSGGPPAFPTSTPRLEPRWSPKPLPDVRFACHGGCPKDRFTDDPYGEPGLNYLCPSFKAFFHHVDEPMRSMSELLTAGRAPSELVRTYATEDAERGRNEPCTCHSGRTRKHRHGAP